jgi:23S rRNA pseudouridine2604 synthase
MATTTRKTLGLPGQARTEERVAGPGRRPVRGGRSNIKRSAATELTISTSPPVKAQPQQKPRGTPSRAPVVVKTRPAARPQSAPAITATLGKTPQSGVRISKLMAERGLCSRREADSYIERGWVFVDGERISELGTRADPSATIKLDKGARAAQQQQITILLHKPVGYVSGQPEPGCTPAVTLVLPENQYCTPDTPRFHASHLKGLAPAGRLDIDSTGLLVLTQDGRVARQLIGENTSVDKEYLVRVEGRLDARGLALLNHGLSLDDRQLKPARVEWLNEDQLRFVLNEGRKRQIRRMCELVGLRAVGLKRVRIGKVKLGDLPLGQWRFLRDDESF